MKYFLGFLLSVGLIICVFLLVLNGFKGNDKPKVEVKPLVSYADTTREVQYTVIGPVTADQDHQSVQITVGRNQTHIQIMRGYNQEVLKSQSFDNNEDAYAEFLRALDLNGFTRGTETPAFEDDRGYCATGKRYVMEMIEGAETVQRFWTSTCSGKGNFKGNNNQIQALFQKQIPNYNTVTQGLVL